VCAIRQNRFPENQPLLQPDTTVAAHFEHDAELTGREKKVLSNYPLGGSWVGTVGGLIKLGEIFCKWAHRSDLIGLLSMQTDQI
jgi:hypothetical protein